jgi:hypothetical protein
LGRAVAGRVDVWDGCALERGFAGLALGVRVRFIGGVGRRRAAVMTAGARSRAPGGHGAWWPAVAVIDPHQSVSTRGPGVHTPGLVHFAGGCLRVVHRLRQLPVGPVGSYRLPALGARGGRWVRHGARRHRQSTHRGVTPRSWMEAFAERRKRPVVSCAAAPLGSEQVVVTVARPVWCRRRLLSRDDDPARPRQCSRCLSRRP